tara:strand:- start:104 stop:406 length:303 start_codon:yes stop_codon:yes gene_type:complete
MKKNFQSLNFKIDKKLIRYANKKIKKLEKYYFSIINFNILFKVKNSSDNVNKFVEFIINIPGESIIVKKTTKSFEKSIALSIKTAERILIKNKQISSKLF